MTIEYIINTPKYSPPQDLFKLDKHLTTWNKSLAPYKKDPQENSCRYQTNWVLKKWVYTTIWEYNSITHNLDKTSVVIYDRFPKSAIHLLLLPLDKKLPNKVSKFKQDHFKQIINCHSACRQLIKNMESSLNVRLVAGYHINPSMDDLHIHIVSDDIFVHKKESFTYPYFVTISQVERELFFNYDLTKFFDDKRTVEEKLFKNNNRRLRRHLEKKTVRTTRTIRTEIPEGLESPEGPERYLTETDVLFYDKLLA